MIFTGTIVNAAAIIAGSLIGHFFHAHLPKRIVDGVIRGMGLITFYIGFTMAMKSDQVLIILVSLVIGTIVGEWINIDKGLENLSTSVKEKFHFKNERFAEGMITPFLLFCMGSMTLLGAIEEGLGNEPRLLLTKSVMDGISSIALASALGISVLFSVIPLLIYQGGITLLTMVVGNQFSQPVLNEMTGVGGILLIGMGFNLVTNTRLKILNMLPALVVAIVLAYFFVKH